MLRTHILELIKLALMLVTLSICILRIECTSVAQTGPSATVTWLVTVPESTSASAQLFMAGNMSALGPWQPSKFRLERIGSRKFQGSLTLPIGFVLEYKFTRGNWGSVEKNVDGSDITNRVLTVDGDASIQVEIAGWGTVPRLSGNTGTGDLRWKNFKSEILGGERRVTVWLPPQYQSDRQARFPVVYFLDGQNVFDASRAAFGSEWQADETARSMASADPPLPMILVAIDNSPNRMDEYTPSSHAINGKQVGGNANQYLTFLCDELKPWIDREFRTLSKAETTTLVGSSLGGLFVLHAMRTRPDVIGNGIAMSPSLFWSDFETLRAFETWNPEFPDDQQLRLWIDMGTREGKEKSGASELIDALHRLESSLRSIQPARVIVHAQVEENGEHNESAWARRLPKALNTLWTNGKPMP